MRLSVTVNKSSIFAFFLTLSLSTFSHSQSHDQRDLDATQKFENLALSYTNEQDASRKSELLLQMEPLAYAGVDDAARFLASHQDYADQRFGWLYLSSLTGNAISEFEIAQIFLTQENEAKAKYWLKKALNNQALVAADTTSNALAMGAMVEWSIVHFGVKGDLSTAMGWYALAAQDRHPSALYALGRASLTGQGVEQDTMAAKSLLMAAAEVNSAPAAQLLALLQQI